MGCPHPQMVAWADATADGAVSGADYLVVLVELALGLPHLLLYLATPYNFVVVCAKRTADMGRSGWWAFVSLVPVVGIFYWLYIGIVKGRGGFESTRGPMNHEMGT